MTRETRGLLIEAVILLNVIVAAVAALAQSNFAHAAYMMTLAILVRVTFQEKRR